MERPKKCKNEMLILKIFWPFFPILAYYGIERARGKGDPDSATGG